MFVYYPSHKSSMHSSWLSGSSAATRAKAAKIKVFYAKKKAAIIKEKASIEANLYVLKLQQEAIAASTEMIHQYSSSLLMILSNST